MLKNGPHLSVSWYDELTESGLLRELRYHHGATFNFQTIQPWESPWFRVAGDAVIDEPSLHQVSSSAGLTILLFEGLAANVEGTFSIVRDQLSLHNTIVNPRLGDLE